MLRPKFTRFFFLVLTKLTTKTKTSRNLARAWITSQVSICHWVGEKLTEVPCLALSLFHVFERIPCKAQDFFFLFLSLVGMKGER